MNLDKITIALRATIPDESKRNAILEIISEDNEAIPDLLKILDAERRQKNNFITEINFQLSRAHMTISTPLLNKDNFVYKEIIEFYKKNKHLVGHCFRIKELEHK